MWQVAYGMRGYMLPATYHLWNSPLTLSSPAAAPRCRPPGSRRVPSRPSRCAAPVRPLPPGRRRPAPGRSPGPSAASGQRSGCRMLPVRWTMGCPTACCPTKPSGSSFRRSLLPLSALVASPAAPPTAPNTAAASNAWPAPAKSPTASR